MARDEDFLAAAAAAAQALNTAREALHVAQAAASREFPSPPDMAPLIDGIVRAMRGLQLPAPMVSVEAAHAPHVTVEAPQVTVQAAPAPAINVEPHFVVEVPDQAPPAVNVAAPVVHVTPPVVHVAAPRVEVAAAPAPAPLPWRMDVHRDPRTQLIVSAEIVPVMEPPPT